MPDRPNILFLMVDELRADATGFAGNETVRTPVLDELASDATMFTNAYTPAPVCVPARQCLMAGQLPKTCDCEGWVDLEPEYYTFARHFAEHGYMTTAAGKLHHQGWDQMQGWRKRLGPTPMKRPTHHKYLDKKDPEAWAEWGRDFDIGSDWTWATEKELKRAGVGQSRVQVEDERVIEDTAEYIKQEFTSPYYDRQRPGDRPLLLKVSLIQPHYPYFTTEEKFTYYLNRVDPHLDESPLDHPAFTRTRIDRDFPVSEREIRRATAAYYGMIETIDEHFGRVLEALDHVGEDLDDWIIVFTSDHGEMLGEHGLWGKEVFYEGSVRVPLFIRWPSSYPDGGVVEANVNLCDLYATLADLAGLPIPDGLDSRSLVPLLTGESEEWRNETVSQHIGEQLLIKQDSLKYQYYAADDSEVLFDLDRDPAETTNFITDPAYEQALSHFRTRRGELGFGPAAVEEYHTAGYSSGSTDQTIE